MLSLEQVLLSPLFSRNACDSDYLLKGVFEEILSYIDVLENPKIHIHIKSTLLQLIFLLMTIQPDSCIQQSSCALFSTMVRILQHRTSSESDRVFHCKQRPSCF